MEGDVKSIFDGSRDRRLVSGWDKTACGAPSVVCCTEAAL